MEMPIEASSSQDDIKFSNSITLLGETSLEFSRILTPSALHFIAKLHKKFNPTRRKLLEQRQNRQREMNSGHFPSFLPSFLKDTKELRESAWTVAPIPDDLLDRRVEITGPVDRKMMINALNSGAQVFMADFEDSHSPTWKGTLEGQINLYDAVRKSIQFKSQEGKEYSLNEKTAVLFVRPRGWHLVEKHCLVDQEPISASLFDFGLYFFHNVKEHLRRGTRPYFYLPKMESHLEARLWNDIFVFSQNELGVPQGTVRATVLIETVLAAFEMDEILYELRDHSAGLNCGRWDYIFSFIKKFQKHPQFILPDRAQVTMNVHFLKSYCQLLVKTCHHRGIHAMGGMAAQIPIKENSQENALAMEKVRIDKEREVSLGHDGTWVAHPGLIPIALDTFNRNHVSPNQIQLKRNEWIIQAADLLTVPQGEVTEQGLRTNIRVSLFYLESWLRGFGCVPIANLMEDAATVEISRSQIWQWIQYGKITKKSFEKSLFEETKQIQLSLGMESYRAGKFELANELLTSVVTNHEFVEFITLPAYEYLA